MYSLTKSDWEIKFSSCWGFLTANPSVVLRLDDVYDHRYGLFRSNNPFEKDVITRNNFESVQTGVSKFSFEEVTFFPTSLYGYYNYKYGCSYIWRNIAISSPYKYRWGITGYHASIHVMAKNSGMIIFGDMLDKEGPFNHLSSYYIIHSRFRSPDDALDLVANYKSLGVAFSPNYAFGFNEIENVVSLYRDCIPIGRVKTGSNRVILKQELNFLKEDLIDFGLHVE